MTHTVPKSITCPKCGSDRCKLFNRLLKVRANDAEIKDTLDRFHVEVPARCPVCHKTQEACSKREMEVVNEIDRLKRLEAGLSIELASCKGEEWMESCRRTGRSRDAHDERKKISRIKKQLRDTRKKLKYYAERPACRRT